MALDPSKGYLYAFMVELWEYESWQPVGDMILNSKEEWYTVVLGGSLRKL